MKYRKIVLVVALSFVILGSFIGYGIFRVKFKDEWYYKNYKKCTKDSDCILSSSCLFCNSCVNAAFRLKYDCMAMCAAAP